jgi:hypothetical protein
MKTLLILVSFLAILSVFAIASADAGCTPISLQNGSKISFTQNTNFAGFFSQMAQSGGGGNYDWSMSLCDASIQASGALACATGNFMVQVQSSSCAVKIATAGIATILNDGSGVNFAFPQTAPQTSSGSTKWTNTVICQCDPNAATLASPSNAYSVVVQGVYVAATFNVRSAGCCVDGGSGGNGGNGNGGDEGGITWGGVFLIIFFVPSGLYVIGMVAWNYRQGKSGRELAPHPEFWGALPSLAKDGIVFIWCKIRGTPFTPSESGSSSSSASGGAEAGTYASV